MAAGRSPALFRLLTEGSMPGQDSRRESRPTYPILSPRRQPMPSYDPKPDSPQARRRPPLHQLRYLVEMLKHRGPGAHRPASGTSRTITGRSCHDIRLKQPAYVSSIPAFSSCQGVRHECRDLARYRVDTASPVRHQRPASRRSSARPGAARPQTRSTLERSLPLETPPFRRPRHAALLRTPKDPFTAPCLPQPAHCRCHGIGKKHGQRRPHHSQPGPRIPAAYGWRAAVATSPMPSVCSRRNAARSMTSDHGPGGLRCNVLTYMCEHGADCAHTRNI